MDSEHPLANQKAEAARGEFPTWPIIIIGMLVGHVILMLVMVYLAVSDRSFAVEPNYYEKAMHWDETQAAQRASDALGWQAELKVAETADTYKMREVQCVLCDNQRQPIQGAEVKLIAFSHARGRQRHAMRLDPGPYGQYHGQLRVDRAGFWEFRITATRDQDTFTETQVVKVVPAAGE